MLNILLLISFIFYLLSLFIGFKISEHKKDKLNKKYFKFHKTLFGIIILTFIFSLIILILASSKVSFLYYLLGFDILFILYFINSVFKETRCWKQHRMIIYNFLLIPTIYFCSLVLNNPYLNLYFIIIFMYNIIEFQFAKFNFKQILIWD